MSVDDWIKKYEKEKGPLNDFQKEMAVEIKNFLDKNNQVHRETTILDFDADKKFDENFSILAGTLGSMWQSQSQAAFSQLMAATKRKDVGSALPDI